MQDTFPSSNLSHRLFPTCFRRMNRHSSYYLQFHLQVCNYPPLLLEIALVMSNLSTPGLGQWKPSRCDHNVVFVMLQVSLEIISRDSYHCMIINVQFIILCMLLSIMSILAYIIIGNAPTKCIKGKFKHPFMKIFLKEIISNNIYWYSICLGFKSSSFGNECISKKIKVELDTLVIKLIFNLKA